MKREGIIPVPNTGAGPARKTVSVIGGCSAVVVVSVVVTVVVVNVG